jgi:IclR family KDG regulon transcriptional repressor
MEEGIKSVERAFLILEEVGQYKDGIGITELATKLNMYKSTIHRVLTTLVSIGYVEQDAVSGRYRLGYRLLVVSSRLLNNLDIRRESLPFLQKLADSTNEVVHLVVLDGGEVVYIEKVEGTETMRMHSNIGKRVPVHCTGVGKSILAHLPPNKVSQIIREYGLEPHTVHTITSEEALLADFQLIRERGYALDMEENELGITCVAAPIWDYTDSVVASVSVSGPTMRIQNERLQQLAERVRDTGKEISSRLGYQQQQQHKASRN